MSLAATGVIIEELSKKPDFLLCAASGSTPTLTYELLTERREAAPGLFEKMRIVKLDEWGGLEMDDPSTCEVYLRKNLVKPLGISEDRYISFCSNPKDPGSESKMVHEKLLEQGPIDLCILGLGLNGHLAFNEPAKELQPFAHVVRLSDASRRHSMLSQSRARPVYGLTLGITEIFDARKILFLVCGRNKNAAMRRFFSKSISTQFPASLLWLHHNVAVLCDENAAYGIDIDG